MIEINVSGDEMRWGSQTVGGLSTHIYTPKGATRVYLLSA
jgi:hypothetical protein